MKFRYEDNKRQDFSELANNILLIFFRDCLNANKLHTIIRLNTSIVIVFKFVLSLIFMCSLLVLKHFPEECYNILIENSEKYFKFILAEFHKNWGFQHTPLYILQYKYKNYYMCIYFLVNVENNFARWELNLHMFRASFYA